MEGRVRASDEFGHELPYGPGPIIGARDQLQPLRVHVIGIQTVPAADVVQGLHLLQQRIAGFFASVRASLEHEIPADAAPQFFDGRATGRVQGKAQERNRHQDCEQQEQEYGSLCVASDIEPGASDCWHGAFPLYFSVVMIFLGSHSKMNRPAQQIAPAIISSSSRSRTRKSTAPKVKSICSGPA